MIHNRMRVEKQIYAGRQAVRQMIKSRQKATLTKDEKPSPPATGSDLPLSVDTDAESAFSNGTRWFYRRGHHSHSSNSQDRPMDSANDPLRSSAVRRKWVADLLQHSNAEMEESSGYRPPPGNGLFRRMRTNSSPNIRLSGVRENPREREAIGRGTTEQSWSSNSSSDDDVSLELEDNNHQAYRPVDEDSNPKSDSGDSDL